MNSMETGNIAQAADVVDFNYGFDPVQLSRQISSQQQPVNPVAVPAPTPADQNLPAPASDPSWYREDGSKKGQGFLGALKFHDGSISTELSIGVNVDGAEMEIPSLVPTLTPEEIAHLLAGGEPTDEIVKKAVDHAILRKGQGKSVWAGDEDMPIQTPVPR